MKAHRKWILASAIGLFAATGLAQTGEQQRSERAGEQATRAEEEGAQMQQQGEIQAEAAQQKQIQGRVMGIDGRELVLEVQGAALPMRVSHDTQIQGQTTPRSRRIETHLREQFSPGQMVSVTYSTENLTNHAMSVQRAGGAQGGQQQGGAQMPPQSR